MSSEIDSDANSKPSPKRFIAGARCPSCEELDKIRCWWEGKLFRSECVSCGYSESTERQQAGEAEVAVIKLPED